MSVNLDMGRVEYRWKNCWGSCSWQSKAERVSDGWYKCLERQPHNLCLVKVMPQPMSGWSWVSI